MKKILALLLTFPLAFALSACSSNDAAQASLPQPAQTEAASSGQGDGSFRRTEGETPITLTIGDTVLDGYLNDSAPARGLIAQLPLTVTLNDSDNDFCGGNLSIPYTESDVTSGYKNGDLAFWTPANNFVIFVNGEEASQNTGNLVSLGRITSPQSMLDALDGTLDVTIALADNAPAAAAAPSTTASEPTENKGEEEMKIKITVGNTELFANLEDNAATRAWMKQLPLTLSMEDLYGREMCYRYGAGALPTDHLRSDHYEVGDLAYWPPRGSLVILYEQNGEQFERQHLGHIESGVEVFKTTGDATVTFEAVK